jgi:retron-type reverse transcriptase
MIDISKAFDLVPHDWLLKKLVDSGVDSKVVVWVRQFFVGRTQRVRVGQLSKQVKVTSGVPQGSVLCPLLFPVYINDICRNFDSSIRLFDDDCLIYGKNTNKKI